NRQSIHTRHVFQHIQPPIQVTFQVCLNLNKVNQFHINKTQIFVENIPCISVTQTDIVQNLRITLLIGHRKTVHQHDEIHGPNSVVPFLSPTFWSLVSNQLTSVVQHPPFQIQL